MSLIWLRVNASNRPEHANQAFWKKGGTGCREQGNKRKQYRQLRNKLNWNNLKKNKNINVKLDGRKI